MVWDPPHRLVTCLNTEIEVRVVATGHQRLDRYGSRRDEMREIFDKGGDCGLVLQRFAAIVAPS